jgi:peptide subunit release factor 1 (eRF1)
MKELLSKKLIQELLTTNKETCLSLYMPTHRSHPENLQDPIRFKNLIKQLEESLLQKYSSGEVKIYLEPLEALVDDNSLWNHTSNGLAVFSATGLFKIVGLPVSVDELAMVADSFHTKPLRQYLQSTDRYHVLGLSLHEIRLFEGNRHSLSEVELTSDTPKTITEALGDELTDKHTTVASYGGSGGESSSMHHGHGGKNEETEKDAERFFRVVANTIYEHFTKPSGWPLILAALPEHNSLFQKVNKNPLLLSRSITINPTSVSIDKLVTLAWEIMEPEYNQKLDSFSSRFEQAKANGKGSDDYKEVAVAAVEGRVDTLIVEADRIIPVRITNLVTGNTQKKDLINPKVDDLLDDMGELVMKMGGQVIVIPGDKMPSETGLAAIFRY